MFRTFASVGVIGAIIIVRLVLNQPSWEQLDQETVTVGPDEAYVIEYVLQEAQPFRIAFSELADHDVSVYWLNSLDHNSLQSAVPLSNPERLMKKIEQQTLIPGAPEGEVEESLGPGTVAIYLEAIEPVETEISYTISTFQ